MLVSESKVQVRVLVLSESSRLPLLREKSASKSVSSSPLAGPVLEVSAKEVETAVVRSTSANVRSPETIRSLASVSKMVPVADPEPTEIVGSSLTGETVTEIVRVSVSGPPVPTLPKSLTINTMESEPL